VGVALMPTFPIADEVAQGRLATAFDAAPAHGEDACHLVWPTARRDYPPPVALRASICAEAKRIV
jgi:DNA-binding transcriptional LysR family regulator